MSETKRLYILPFNAIGSGDLPRVGGKGANLGEMTRAGFPVPPGFCVITDAFRCFLQASDRAEEIYRSLEELPPDDVEGTRQVGAQVRAWLSDVPIPAEIEEAVVAAWQELGPEESYAVRSSATAEDLPDTSFAGQQDTFLNIIGKQRLLESVRACWISLFTDRAILYRAQNGFSHRDVLLSVVVQRMILPEVSGILFTADPVSGHRQIISIDASYGLGEALVAGLVSPDLYKVDKRSHTITEVKVSEKHLAIRPQAGGGTYHKELQGAARQARVLNDEQVLALADLGIRIEAHYGRPQDIEWCLAQGQIYIVQSRPITSLFPLPQPRPTDAGLHLYFSFSHAQVMTDPMTPMGISLWQLIFPFGKGRDLSGYNPYVTSAAGRIYIDITSLLRLPKLGHAFPNIIQVADKLSAQALRAVTMRPEFLAGRQYGHARWTILARWLLPVWAGVIARVFILPPEGTTERLSAFLEELVQSVRAQLAAAPAGLPRLQVAQKLTVTMFPKHVMRMPPYLAGGMLARVLLTRLMRGVGDPEQVNADLDAILRGLHGNVTTEMDLRVGDLADAARKSPALVQHLSSDDPRSALATIHTIPGSEEFLAEWQRFIEQYGMRGPSEIDIGRTSWAEEPGSLLQVVSANLQHSTPGAHRTKHSQLAAEGDAAAIRLVEAAHTGPLGAIRARLVRRLVRVARNLLPMREHPKYLMIRIRGLIRQVILECAEMLHKQGRINEVNDVWYLAWHELAAALQNPNQELRELISTRQQEYLRFWQIVPPRVITSDGEIPTVSHEQANLPPGALAGNPVSAGIVEGKAKVILDPHHEMLNPGEILVAPFTDPGWTPLFINAAGLVMEVGGLMTHGSVVAREYGIPAVVSVLDATKKIQTGQRIRVNGSEGYVEILDSE